MGEERYLYFIEFRDQNGDNKKMAIYDVDNIDECSRVFREYEGEKAVIKNMVRMSESEYKARF